MAKIDDMLRNVHSKGGVELFLRTGAAAQSRNNGQSTPLGGANLTTEQINELILEIVPAKRAAMAEFRFQYASPLGHYTGMAQRGEDTVQLIVRKGGTGEPAFDQPMAPPAAAAAPAPAAAPAAAPADDLSAAEDISAVEEAPAAPAAPRPPAPPVAPAAPAAPRPPVAPAAPARPAAPAPAPAPQQPAMTVPQPQVVYVPAPAPSAYGDLPELEKERLPRSALAQGAVPRINKLMEGMVKAGASDLHLSSMNPPMLRVDGSIVKMAGENTVLSPEVLWSILAEITPERNIREFEKSNDTDFAYAIPGLGRFRSNIFRDRKGPGAVFRIIPSKLLTADDLNLPEVVRKFANLSKGLVLVTGPTGSGKSTTLAAIIDLINATRDDHIITVEDPIEFIHENKKCLINAREIHQHTGSFKAALRAALREDPDIVLVGEMRDLETIEIAIETAETGHLVFGTLHTNTAPSTVNRIIEQFPADRQEQIRVMLSESLKGVVTQTLLKKIGKGRIAALEILIITSGIANLIRENKTFQIPSIMQTAKGEGMTTLNDVLCGYVQKGLVDFKEAYIKAVDKKGFLATAEGYKLPVQKLMDQLNTHEHA